MYIFDTYKYILRVYYKIALSSNPNRQQLWTESSSVMIAGQSNGSWLARSNERATGTVINEQFGGRPDSCPVFFSLPLPAPNDGRSRGRAVEKRGNLDADP